MCVQIHDSLVTIYLGPRCETVFKPRVSICPWVLSLFANSPRSEDYFYLGSFLMSLKLFMLLFSSEPIFHLTFNYIFSRLARKRVIDILQGLLLRELLQPLQQVYIKKGMQQSRKP